MGKGWKEESANQIALIINEWTPRGKISLRRNGRKEESGDHIVNVVNPN
jgi:hypothetical protein